LRISLIFVVTQNILESIHGTQRETEAEDRQTRALLLFVTDLEINAMTLKLEGDLDILKMYRHTENEVASIQNLELELGKCVRVKGQCQMSKAANHF